MLAFPSLNALGKPQGVDGPSPVHFPGSEWLLRVLTATADHMLPAQDRRLRLEVSEFVGSRYQETNRELGRLIGIDLRRYGYH